MMNLPDGWCVILEFPFVDTNDKVTVVHSHSPNAGVVLLVMAAVLPFFFYTDDVIPWEPKHGWGKKKVTWGGDWTAGIILLIVKQTYLLYMKLFFFLYFVILSRMSLSQNNLTHRAIILRPCLPKTLYLTVLSNSFSDRTWDNIIFFFFLLFTCSTEQQFHWFRAVFLVNWWIKVNSVFGLYQLLGRNIWVFKY